MEVEFVSHFEVTSHGVWLKSFIVGLRLVISSRGHEDYIYDNSIVVFLAKNDKSEGQSKHLNIKYLSI